MPCGLAGWENLGAVGVELRRRLGGVLEAGEAFCSSSVDG
jgi:hypothetical protein